MLTRYNIALIPTDANDQLLAYGNTFSDKAHTYKLGPRSIPHITLCHFQAEEQQIPVIFERLTQLKLPAIQLTFDTLRSKTYPNSPWGADGMRWISLMPDKFDKLKEMHYAVASLVKPTNAAFDQYDPHLTLVNTLDSSSDKINESPRVNTRIQDQFIIALGRSDDVGQLTETLYYQPRMLTAPATPKEAIASRRNPCYGFCIIADIQSNEPLLALLAKTRDVILNSLYPERTSQKSPIRSSHFIKQTFFHATVGGMTPVLKKEDFFEIYANEQGLLTHDRMDTLCEVLKRHAQQKPYLSPMQCELMPDGTILARFAYKTQVEDATPLLTLATQLDPAKKFVAWDAANLARYKTVAIALSVIDKDILNDITQESIKTQLASASRKMQELGSFPITQFQLINYFDKRTLSLKHIEMYASVGEEHINRVCRAR